MVVGQLHVSLNGVPSALVPSRVCLAGVALVSQSAMPHSWRVHSIGPGCHRTTQSSQATATPKNSPMSCSTETSNLLHISLTFSIVLSDLDAKNRQSLTQHNITLPFLWKRYLSMIAEIPCQDALKHSSTSQTSGGGSASIRTKSCMASRHSLPMVTMSGWKSLLAFPSELVLPVASSHVQMLHQSQLAHIPT